MRFGLILASGSPYRKELLARLRIPFDVMVSDVDETPLPDELPDALAVRLGKAKCFAVANQNSDAWVIGSDQVASSEGHLFGKPGSHERAVEQLKKLQGKSLDLFTSLSVWNPMLQVMEDSLDHTVIKFSVLPESELEAYLHADQPYQCAASAKIESMGIGLVEEMQTRDPTAIVGLPMIALTKILRAGGVNIFAGRHDLNKESRI